MAKETVMKLRERCRACKARGYVTDTDGTQRPCLPCVGWGYVVVEVPKPDAQWNERAAAMLASDAAAADAGKHGNGSKK
jgi:hypothetical protein